MRFIRARYLILQLAKRKDATDCTTQGRWLEVATQLTMLNERPTGTMGSFLLHLKDFSDCSVCHEEKQSLACPEDRILVLLVLCFGSREICAWLAFHYPRAVPMTASGLQGKKPLANSSKWLREVGKLEAYLRQKLWLQRLSQ